MDRSARALGSLRALPDQCERLQRGPCESKMAALACIPEERVLALNEILRRPRAEVGRIIECAEELPSSHRGAVNLRPRPDATAARGPANSESEASFRGGTGTFSI